MFKSIHYATPPSVLHGASSATLRGHYLVEDLFGDGELNLSYVHQERMIVGGAVPGHGRLDLPAQSDGAALLARRELGVVNIGPGAGAVSVDGTDYRLERFDALYIGQGARDVAFTGPQARFYLASTPAHSRHDTRLLPRSAVVPLERGAERNSNARSIYQFITPDTCPSAQLLMGLTEVARGNVWNTLPPHRHEHRSEVYFYFGLDDPERLFHIMGTPEETRHIVVKNEEAVICPSWSVHMGAGTSAYTFVWAMGGDNLDYDDMAGVSLADLR
jgi:4-deoxy-L-threo-5-hexosulose-uronate ketol-isomerase